MRPIPVFRMENTLVLQLLIDPELSLAVYRDAAATSTTIGHCNDGLLCLRNVRRSEVNGTRCPLITSAALPTTINRSNSRLNIPHIVTQGCSLSSIREGVHDGSRGPKSVLGP